eukprot:jgi/Mesvir1/7934/Mv11856-RA.1
MAAVVSMQAGSAKSAFAGAKVELRSSASTGLTLRAVLPAQRSSRVASVTCKVAETHTRSVEEAEKAVVAGNIPECPAAPVRAKGPTGTPVGVAQDLAVRPRRNRKSPALRKAFAETLITPANLILPLFIHEGDLPQPIGSMPGCYRLGWRTGLLKEVRQAVAEGVNNVILFPKVPDALKTRCAEESYNPDGIVPRSIRLLKSEFPDLVIYTDVATYQMNPANWREALRECMLDEAEGADIMMVKPAMPYLDIIRQLRDNSTIPISAYQVSGEYAMIKAAVERGWLDERKAVLESLLSIKRAGADLILTYFATQAARYMNEK